MRRRLLALSALALLASWFVTLIVQARQFGADLRQAERQVAGGEFRAARAKLAGLAERWPHRAEVAYWLGVCEAAEGHVDEALAAWARVPIESPHGRDASMHQARLALEHGRFAVAEQCLEQLRVTPGGDGEEARRLLGQVYWLSGRFDDYRRLLRRTWAQSRKPAESLRLLWMLDTVPYAVEAFRSALDKAEREAPDDDRVWLGEAGLALRLGNCAEADRRLKFCESRRAADPAVHQARLEWALACDRLDEAAQVLLKLPAERFSPAQGHTLRARFAAARHDVVRERTELTALLEQDPGAGAALERLAEMAARDGRVEDVARLRRQKTQLDQNLERYRHLLTGDDPVKQARDLAQTAEALGRWFDARAWWTLLARYGDADDEARAAIARLDRREPRPPSPGQTLADFVGDLGEIPTNFPPEHSSSSPMPQFVDNAEAARLRFAFDNGRSPLRQLPETMGGGVGLLDYDGDGWLDVYVVQGGPFPPAAGPTPNADRLFRNRGDGTFQDMTGPSRIGAMPGGYGHGVGVGDIDKDGRPDLFVTRWRAYALYRNRGDGTFEDVTERFGLGGDRDWPTSAAFADLDGDGDLDLYVCHYLRWDSAHPRACYNPETRGIEYCDPRDFEALPDHVFRNDGGRFVDVSSEAGIVDRDGRGLGVVADDLDGDGLIDLFVANDTSANFLFHNLGGFRFRESAMEAGVATNAGGGYQAGMGIACGDLDGDGLVDLAVTNFFGESTTFYHNLGAGQFADHTAAIGLATPSRFLLGFGIAFLDANNDGRLDLASANGHVNDFRPGIRYAMPAQLLIGGAGAGGRLLDVSERAGPPWQVPRVGRGLAAGDLDNDGRTDLLIVSDDTPLAYFHNRTEAGRSLTLVLEGTVSNRDAVGARVAVTTGRTRQLRRRFGGGSYLSAGDARLHFGSGSARVVDEVEVTWPSGRVDRHSALKTNAIYRIREGDPAPKPILWTDSKDGAR